MLQHRLGLMLDVLMLFTGGAASPYYAGAGLVILGATLLIPWGPAWSAVVSAAIVAGYVVCAMPTAGGDQGHLFLSNLFYMSGTGVLAVATSVAYERLRWREFTTRRDLVDAYRQRSVFLANMSHELRTPIHVMIGYADILLESALARGGEEARTLVEVSRRQGILLHRLISDLLDFSKIEAGKMDLHVEPLDLGAVSAAPRVAWAPALHKKIAHHVRHVMLTW